MSAIGALRQLEKEKSKDAGKGGIKVRVASFCGLRAVASPSLYMRARGCALAHTSTHLCDLQALFTSLPSRIRQSGPVKSSLTFAKAVRGAKRELVARRCLSRGLRLASMWCLQSWNKSSRWLWIFSTTMLITLVPLSIEVRPGSCCCCCCYCVLVVWRSPLTFHPVLCEQLLREEQTNEIVKELLGKGFTYNQIQGMGYSVSAPQSTLAAEGAPQ